MRRVNRLQISAVALSTYGFQAPVAHVGHSSAVRLDRSTTCMVESWYDKKMAGAAPAAAAAPAPAAGAVDLSFSAAQARMDAIVAAEPDKKLTGAAMCSAMFQVLRPADLNQSFVYYCQLHHTHDTCVCLKLAGELEED